MMKYTWKCADCAIAATHVSQSANPYLVGFEIYSTHRQHSPNCKNLALEILEGDAETLIQSESFRCELNRFQRLSGIVEVDQNMVTLYRGFMPKDLLDAFAGRLKRCDPSGLLNIVVSTKDRL